MPEQTRQDTPRVTVVFHNENAQRDAPFPRCWRCGLNHVGLDGQNVQRDAKSRTLIAPATFRDNRAAMQLDDIFRDRQAEPEPAKLPGHGAFALLEGIEQRGLLFNWDPDAGIDDLDLKMPGVVIRRADLDSSAGIGELHRI